MPFGCMSMARLGAKYAVVGCESMETFGCMYAVVGCKYAETVGCKVCCCWVQSMRRRLGACLTVGSLPDGR